MIPAAACAAVSSVLAGTVNEIIRLSLGEGSTLELVEGDITTESTDAIVNAANSSLMGGGGVDGAIHRAGGPEILEECRKIVARQGSLATGQSVATSGGRLKAGYVIHTVGPVWQGGNAGEPEKLASCYRESLRVADQMHLQSVAFPSIATGVYGYPVALAADVALRTVVEALPVAKHVREVRFVLFGSRAMQTFTSVLEKLSREKPQRSRIERVPSANQG